jgi:hypothetical protein
LIAGIMKKIAIWLCACLIAGGLNAQVKKLQDIKGHWMVGGEKDAALVIVDSANIVLSYGGEIRKVTDVKMDFSKSPCWFDFSASGDSSAVIHIKSLMDWSADGVMKWQLFIDEERPSHFVANKGEMLYLKRTNARTSATAITAKASQ